MALKGSQWRCCYCGRATQAGECRNCSRSPSPGRRNGADGWAAGEAAHPLLAGYGRFRWQQYPRMQDLFRRLEAGESPGVCFITCSDSRVQPALLTQSQPGELVVLRTAGNILPSFGRGAGEEATLEYAIAVLRVRHIIVCGHSGCTAMAGLLGPERVQMFPALWQWIRQSEPALRRMDASQATSPKEQLEALVRENVLLQLERLRLYPFVEAGLQAGRLRLHGWIYDIGAGSVLEFEQDGRRLADPRVLGSMWT